MPHVRGVEAKLQKQNSIVDAAVEENIAGARMTKKTVLTLTISWRKSWERDGFSISWSQRSPLNAVLFAYIVRHTCLFPYIAIGILNSTENGWLRRRYAPCDTWTRAAAAAPRVAAGSPCGSWRAPRQTRAAAASRSGLGQGTSRGTGRSDWLQQPVGRSRGAAGTRRRRRCRGAAPRTGLADSAARILIAPCVAANSPSATHITHRVQEYAGRKPKVIYVTLALRQKCSCGFHQRSTCGTVSAQKLILVTHNSSKTWTSISFNCGIKLNGCPRRCARPLLNYRPCLSERQSL